MVYKTGQLTRKEAQDLVEKLKQKDVVIEANIMIGGGYSVWFKYEIDGYIAESQIYKSKYEDYLGDKNV